VAAGGVVIAALVISLSPSHPAAPTAGPSSDPGPSGTAPASTPTVGDLLVVQMRVGDCLTGANMELDTSDPWPKLTLAVPCSQPHTAEVFFADNHFWPKNGAYPGDGTVSEDGNAACNSAFQSYVGIAYAKSMYAWANIIPDASTWPAGDRALHCIAYDPTPGQPAGAKMTGSIRGTRK
jgi:hypothetical protein